jgi:hypothetical protein
MEFLRFGSSIPGTYWGCCAADIIQNFNVDPDTKSSIQLVSGDGGGGITHPKGGFMYAGPTYRDIFLQRLRIGTFNTREMPNHAFFVMLSRTQIDSATGKKWLAILKAEGFEFVRTVNNSVWNKDNYVFALFRNVGPNAVKDQFTPPAAWTDLPDVVPEPWRSLPDTKKLTADIAAAQKPFYYKLPNNAFLSEEEVTKAGAPVVLAGLRSTNPQEAKTTRDNRQKAQNVAKAVPLKTEIPF